MDLCEDTCLFGHFPGDCKDDLKITSSYRPFIFKAYI